MEEKKKFIKQIQEEFPENKCKFVYYVDTNIKDNERVISTYIGVSLTNFSNTTYQIILSMFDIDGDEEKSAYYAFENSYEYKEEAREKYNTLAVSISQFLSERAYLEEDLKDRVKNIADKNKLIGKKIIEKKRDSRVQKIIDV